MLLEARESKNPSAYVPTSDRQAKFARILEGISDPQAVRKAMDGFLEDMSKDTVTLVINADGTYGVAPRTDAERIRALSFGECGGLGIKREKSEKSGNNPDLE